MPASRGLVETDGAVNYTGSGTLRRITVVDVSNAVDATIAINIDSVGSQTITAVNFGVIGSATDSGSVNQEQGVININAAANGAVWVRDFNLPFRSNLTVTITSATGSMVEYDRDVF